MSNKEMVTTETVETGKQVKMKVFVPNKLLECLPRSPNLPKERLRWNTNEEIASFLTSFDHHEEWLSYSLKTRPVNGSIILYNRKKVKYRKDGYCWKKRKDGKTTREDHMKLKVQGMECLYGCYVHSSIVPTFHRRCYWLLQNPDIVLVHYLNVPSLEDSGKCGPLLCSVSDRHDSLRWSQEELVNQLKPMFHSMKWSVGSADFSVEQLVQHILDQQQTKPQPRTHTCLCNTTLVSSGGNVPHRCNSTKHRIISPKLSSEQEERGGGGGGGGGGEKKPPHLSSPSPPTSSSPPRPFSAANIGGRVNGFYGDHCNGVTAVALPQNAVIVMATTSALTGGGGGGGEEEGQRRRSQLLLSPRPPSTPPPGSSTLSLTLLPSPVIGGLLLSSPPPPPPPSLPPPFNPDAFLNSPKRGQTYGGPPPLPCSPPLSLSSLSSSEPDREPAFPPSLPPLCLELEEEEEEEEQGPGQEEVQAPPSKLPLLQPSHTSSVLLPQQPPGSGTPSLLLIGRDTQSPTPQLQVANKTPPHGDRQKPKPHCLSNHTTQPTTTNASLSQLANQQQLLLQESEREGDQGTEEREHGRLNPAANAASSFASTTASNSQRATSTTLFSLHANSSMARSQVHIKEEGGRSSDEEHMPMETHSTTDEHGGRVGEELDISFDSQFPDLISELITEENTAVHPNSAPNSAHGTNQGLFHSAVRYMVPPQPSPSSSFLPFPILPPSSSSSRLPIITDFSPEWSYPEGGVKVLITGPWVETTGRYSCLFDQSSVSASLIQPGVLRCYCPAHEAGLVCLQVVESGVSASSSVLFEYRARNSSSLPSSQLDWLSLDDNQFRMSILERLEHMERRMAQMAARENTQQQQQPAPQQDGWLAVPPAQPDDQSQWFERRIVAVCEQMMKGGRWRGRGDERLHHSIRHRGMTLLHLAAAQGYTQLIHTLFIWRSINSDSLDLEEEVDPLNVDHFSCTPLVPICPSAVGMHERIVS